MITFQAIHERIKGLDFQECKVRVLNVDSQASFDNIVVCVIGEISNKSAPPRKFIQTFILAEQPNGYYVLNDIFRYLVDEEEDIVAEEAPVEGAPVVEQSAVPAQEETKAAPEPDVERQADNEAAAEQVNEKLEEATTNGEVKPAVEEQPRDELVKEEAPAAEPVEPVEPAEPAEPAAPVEVEPEKPKEPEPTPAAVTPAKATTPAPEKESAAPPKPAVPMSWASIASKSSSQAVPTTTTPPVATPVPAAPVTKPKAAPAPQKPAAPAQSAEVEKVPSQASSSNGEWQTADHGKRQSRPEGPTNAYVKNVNDKVDASLLKEILGKHGELKYFNVDRVKVCSFRPSPLNIDTKHVLTNIA